MNTFELLSMRPNLPAEDLGQSIGSYLDVLGFELVARMAFQEECRLVTADKQLYDAIAPTYPETMLWIEEVHQATVR